MQLAYTASVPRTSQKPGLLALAPRPLNSIGSDAVESMSVAHVDRSSVLYLELVGHLQYIMLSIRAHVCHHHGCVFEWQTRVCLQACLRCLQALLAYVQLAALLKILDITWPSALGGLFKFFSWIMNTSPQVQTDVLYLP